MVRRGQSRARWPGDAVSRTTTRPRGFQDCPRSTPGSSPAAGSGTGAVGGVGVVVTLVVVALVVVEDAVVVIAAVAVVVIVMVVVPVVVYVERRASILAGRRSQAQRCMSNVVIVASVAVV